MFKKLESILSTRFSQFQPRSLLEVLHACIHLERFPLNHLSRVFSPYFLQRLHGEATLCFLTFLFVSYRNKVVVSDAAIVLTLIGMFF